MDGPMMCPKCKSKNIKILIEFKNDPDHNHLKCLDCENEFNWWLGGIEKIKEIFGKNWELYE
jgi:transposase-like protein